MRAHLERTKAIRLAMMALLAWEGKQLTAGQCADLFEVSVRTAQRDLIELERIIPVLVRVGDNLGGRLGAKPTRVTATEHGKLMVTR